MKSVLAGRLNRYLAGFKARQCKENPAVMFETLIYEKTYDILKIT